MSSFTNIVTIDRPARVVFAFLADLENVPRWNYAITETRKTTSGDVGVGTMYEQTRSIPAPTREQLTITEFEPDRRITVVGALARFPARLEYTMEERDGRTRLSNTVDLQLAGAVRLLGGIAAGRIRSAVAENLNTLKQVLEADVLD
jgi:carbon monoxide dehydrogenase subunit G